MKEISVKPTKLDIRNTPARQATRGFHRSILPRVQARPPRKAALCAVLGLVLALGADSTAQPVRTIRAASTGIGDAIAVGPNGDIFGCPGRGIQTLIRITPNGERSIFAQGHGSPTGIDFDSKGNIFVVNYQQNNVVKLTPEGEVSVFASRLNGPAHLVINRADELFVSEFGANFSGTGRTVVKILPDGTMTDYLVGQGLQDVIGLALDEDENLYVGNWQSGRIYKSTGPSQLALFADVNGTVNQIGYHRGFVYAPSNDRKIYRIDRQGRIHHFAGDPRAGRNDGLLLESRFPLPNSIAFSNDGDTIYINDGPDGALRSLSLIHDTDADGVSDAAEQLPGTDPTDQASVFRIRLSAPAPKAIELVWPGSTNRTYEVLFSTDLRTWRVIEGSMTTAPLSPASLPSFTTQIEDPIGYFQVQVK
jgi:sugar lactone lactonase YvrE